MRWRSQASGESQQTCALTSQSTGSTLLARSSSDATQSGEQPREVDHCGRGLMALVLDDGHYGLAACTNSAWMKRLTLGCEHVWVLHRRGLRQLLSQILEQVRRPTKGVRRVLSLPVLSINDNPRWYFSHAYWFLYSIDDSQYYDDA